MTKKREQAAGYVPNPHYTQEDWDEVSDNPALTDEQLAALRPAVEVLPPSLYEGLVKRHRGPQKEPTKELISLRLDPDVVEGFRKGGPGWQSRMNDALRHALGLE